MTRLSWPLLVLALAAGACERSPADPKAPIPKAPDPYAHLYGRYELHVWMGDPLPVRWGTGSFGGEDVQIGTVVLSEGGKYERTQRGSVGNSYGRVGTFMAKGDTILADDGFRFVLDGPVLVGTNLPGGRESAWVRAGSEPPPAYRYRTYRLATYDARPVPQTNTEPGLQAVVTSGHLWLWANGRFDRQTKPNPQGYCCPGPERGQYTMAGDSITLTLRGVVEKGTAREPNVTIGLFGYVAQ